MGGFASSRILEVHGERMIKRTFDPGFRIELHQKDLNLALSGARALGVACRTPRPRRNCSTPARPTAAAKWDHSALVRALEKLGKPRDYEGLRAEARATCACALCPSPGPSSTGPREVTLSGGEHTPAGGYDCRPEAVLAGMA